VRPSVLKSYSFSLQPTRGEKEETPRLPKFKPIKQSELLRTTTGGSRRQMTTEEMVELLRRVDAQQTELLKALGIDPNNPDWAADAFVLLARIHHGVGVIHIDKARAPNKHAAKWTLEHDKILLAAMRARLGQGKTATAALKEIAGDKSIWQQLPQVKNSYSQKSPTARRVETYRKRWGLISKIRVLDSVQSAILDGLASSVAATRQKKRLNKPSS
jgi:hypothetical protein